MQRVKPQSRIAHISQRLRLIQGPENAPCPLLEVRPYPRARSGQEQVAQTLVAEASDHLTQCSVIGYVCKVQRDSQAAEIVADTVAMSARLHLKIVRDRFEASRLEVEPAPVDWQFAEARTLVTPSPEGRGGEPLRPSAAGSGVALG